MSIPNLPIPNRLQMTKIENGLRFSYKNHPSNALLWLFLGLFIIGVGISENDNGGDVLTLFCFVLGLGMVYIGLVVLINRATLLVTHNELNFLYAPLPIRRSRQVKTIDLQQLLVQARKADAGQGEFTYYVLQAVLRDGRKVDLVSEFPSDVLRFIEIQIESWLGIKNNPNFPTGDGQRNTLPTKIELTGISSLPIPNRLSMIKDNNGLFFSYRIPPKAALLTIASGFIFVLPGLFFLIALYVGEEPRDLGEVIQYLLAIFVFGIGLVAIYIGLAALVNRATIRVTKSDFLFRYGPLPLSRSIHLQTSDLKQLFVQAQEADTGQGKFTFYVLRGVLNDGRKVNLARELPSDVLQFIELQLESWLGITDSRETGELGG